MPNTNRSQTVHLGKRGDPDLMNEETLMRPGELGVAFDFNNRSYQIVQVDSGCTVTTPTGTLATAGTLAFWKDRSTYLVTNDSRFALLGGTANSFANNVAGLFRGETYGTSTINAGYYTAILQRGYNIQAKATAGVALGEMVVADTTANTCYVDGPIALGTAITYQVLGICKTASTGAAGYAYVNFDIPNIP